MKKRNKTDSEKLDLILANTIALNEKVEQQNSEIASLKSEVKSLEVMVHQMAKKHRLQSLQVSLLMVTPPPVRWERW